MKNDNLAHDSLSEQQAAQWLGITIEGLHQLLDQHIFNNGTIRPEEIRFTHADLLLLSYWCDPPKAGKVVPMPRRER